MPTPMMIRNARIALAALVALPAPLVIPFPAAAASKDAERTSYVLFHTGGDSSTMSGSTDDIGRAKALRTGREALLYFRHGGTAYVIRDVETLRRAEALTQPQRELGAQQAGLGRRQAALGRSQADLGLKQASLGARQANASPRRASDLSRDQAELGRQQHALGEQQNALGARQSALGREQARLSRIADEGFRALFAEAIRDGTAQRVD
jgi:bla regulator protein blaR1